jgi:hypothetical protein
MAQLLLALTLTMTLGFVEASVDIIGWQCGRPGTSCGGATRRSEAGVPRPLQALQPGPGACRGHREAQGSWQLAQVLVLAIDRHQSCVPSWLTL